MRFYDSEKMLGLSFQKELDSCHAVQVKPVEDLPEQEFRRIVLCISDQVISEIEKGLAAGDLAQCSATNVIDHRCGLYIDSIAKVFETPAQIDLFHVRKIISVKTFYLPKSVCPHK